MGTGTEVPPCIGIVLAGGRSSRMGRDKALLHINGLPLIEHQMQLLRDAGIDDVRVSGYRPDYAGIEDAVVDAGPLGGLAGVAVAMDDADLLVLPVDMPCIGVGLLQRLCGADAEARCVRFGQRVLPMRLCLDVTTRTAVENLLSDPDPRARSLRALQAHVGVRELALQDGDEACFVDCNSPSDWQAVNA